MNQTWVGFCGAILGALIGGVANFISTRQAHINNTNLEKRKEKLCERAVILSIAEELKSLLSSYETEMDYMFQTLPDNSFLESAYTITQDFMTIYSNNANKIGSIKNDELRALIITSYTYLKRYIEYLLNYANELENGEGGIRTHGKCYPSQTFEIRTLNHSDTSPEIQRGWDSNPRWNCSHTTFPRLHLKPLGHLSLSIHLYSSALIMPKSIPLFYLNPA